MHDQQSLDRMNMGNALGHALRSLPTQAPPRDAWPQIEARVQQQRRRRRRTRIMVPAALAAGLALVIAWPLARERFAAAPTTRLAQTSMQSTVTASDMAHLARLRSHSLDLQRWVRQLRGAGGPVSGSALAEIAELEDRIGLLDLQLDVATEPRLQVALWTRRNALLKQLGVLRLAPTGFATASLTTSAQAETTAWTQ